MVQRRWVYAAPVSDVPPGSARSVLVDGRWFALFCDEDGTLHATDDACPHEGTSLGDGIYHEGRVICRSHDWVFDVRTGRCLRTPGVTLACYATRRVGDAVEIEVEARG